MPSMHWSGYFGFRGNSIDRDTEAAEKEPKTVGSGNMQPENGARDVVLPRNRDTLSTGS